MYRAAGGFVTELTVRSGLANENWTGVDRGDQNPKGAWWMPWHREAMKDVVACEKLRGSGKQESIRRYLNEETQPGNPRLLLPECIG